MNEPTSSMPDARRLTLPKRARVVRRGEFQRAYGEGVRVRGSILMLVMVENGLEHSRIGLSIGKSIWRGAVQRNRVRRMFREAFRLTQNDAPRGFDVIAIAARPQLEPELVATMAEMVALLRKGAARWRSTSPEERAAERARRDAARAAKSSKPNATKSKAKKPKPAKNAAVQPSDRPAPAGGGSERSP